MTVVNGRTRAFRGVGEAADVFSQLTPRTTSPRPPAFAGTSSTASTYFRRGFLLSQVPIAWGDREREGDIRDDPDQHRIGERRTCSRRGRADRLGGQGHHVDRQAPHAAE